MRTLVMLAVAVLLSFSLAAETLQQFDARVEAELRASDPVAAALWSRANAARMADRHEEAAGLYADLHLRVPESAHALRRLSYEENRLGQRAVALQHAREALAMERSAENMTNLADILVPDDTTASSLELMEAKGLAIAAAELKPDDPFPQAMRARVALAMEDADTLRESTERLEALEPNEANTHVLRFYSLASDGKFSAARASLERAAALGLPKAQYDVMSAQLEAAEPFYVRWWKPVAIGLAVWFGGFALLLGAGALLSRVAIRAAAEVPEDLSANATGLSHRLRRTYAAVLFLSSLFYYLSIPIVIALVLGIGGSLIYGAFVIGHIPIKLVGLIVVLMAVSVWSMLKSLFIRANDAEPGLRLDMERQPRLRALLDEVAARIGTHAVDNVYMTPATEVAVMERGKGKPKERCLILGVAALDGLSIRPLKAVLGHEYGHFTNRDTAGGASALRVRNSISATAFGLARGGAAVWYNPAWLFVNGFYKVFMRISEGASRLQEVLADRWAVFAYGADAFEAGLRHIVARGVLFHEHIGATLKEVVDRKLPLQNLYTYQPAARNKFIDDRIEEALHRQTSAYDSHPSPADRFALVHALSRHGAAADTGDDAPAWSLFDDALALQHVMTAKVRENVRANYGVEIAGEALVAPA
jgi:Zn-dependent protease with chaperone function